MKKKNYLSLLVTLTALGIASSIPVPTLQAGGGDGADKSLLPVVFLTLDTSGSMRDSMGSDNNTRMTQALQELTGTAKTKSSKMISASYTRFPRKQLQCFSDENVCRYETVWVCGWNYSQKNNSTKCKYVINSSLTEDSQVRNLVNGFDGDEQSFVSSYTGNGIIQRYMNTVKFGFATMYCYYPYYYPDDNNTWRYGSRVQTVPGFTNGTKDINDKDISYKYGFTSVTGRSDRRTLYCNGNGGGMWDADIKGPTPLQYPTTSDEPLAVRASNEAVIYNVRSFTLSGGNTPLGDMIEDVALMFNNDGQIDPGLITQPKPNGFYNEPSIDTSWKCRAKGVIAMTDGYPNTPVDSAAAANKLYQQNVKVYSVAYANSTAHPNDGGVGSVMNKIAWKGGTCREYGHTGEIIKPEDTTGYNKYLTNVKNNPSVYKSCFYNAYNGIALKQAMQSIMNELLQGYTSKSKMVSTTAVGKLTTLDENGKPTNGWYNVYSGYQINLGSMRNSGLQREAYVCRDGQFKYDKNLYIDLAKKLDSRLVACRAKSIFASTSTGPVGDCIKNRAIFVGDYSEDTDAFNKGRYALKPTRIHFSETGAGIFRYTNADDEIGVHNQSYQFFAYDNDLYDIYSKAKTTALTSTRDSDNEIVTDYIVSPYECVTEVDCICTSNSKRADCIASDDINNQYMCDQGKCVLQSEFQNLKSCTSSVNACGSDAVCIGGQCRPLASGSGSCKKHSDCMSGQAFGSADLATQNQICHAGKCVNGVLSVGDIRDLVASIPLGAIEYASPVIVGPPSYSYHGADYVTFKNDYADRDTMMYVPANDGMLHAFILGKNNDKTYNGALFNSGISSPQLGDKSASQLEGEELWAFIPRAVMNNLHSLTEFGEQKKINVSPVYADVQFPDGRGGGKWHSVIVGGFREGGRGYYALDVTEPDNPQILWEIDHQWQNADSDIPYPPMNNDMAVSVGQETEKKAEGLYPFIRMGYSYPEAIITNVIVDNEIVPVAVLPGGVSSGKPTTDCNSAGVCAPDVTGKAVFVVRLNPSSKDDLLVREFQFDTRISGTPSAFPAGFNSIARVIYVGDENGALHRIDVSDPNMDNWKIDGVSVTTTGKVAKASQKLIPIFDPNNTKVLQGSIPKSYEKITYKPAVSALTSTGFPDIQIVFGSGDSSNTAIDTQDLNYTAVMIDHYVNDEIGYQLNNFNDNKIKDARTSNLNPLVIVFNPTPGIVHRDLASYATPSGNQYFEVWAGKVQKSDKPTPEDTEPTPDDFCAGCSEEDCGTNASCASCPYCVCLSERQSCELEKSNCEMEYNQCKMKYEICDSAYQSCELLAQHNYERCLENNERVCSECIENNRKECSESCKEECVTPCNDVIDNTCETVAENQFCDKVWKDSILADVTHLWGSERVCKKMIGKIKTIIIQNEYLLSDPNYCSNVQGKCEERCKSETWWESKVGYAEAYAQCLKDWANNVNACIGECNTDINYCKNTSKNEFNSCRRSCKLYQVACHAHNLGCDISYAAKLVACGAVWTGCTANCTIGQVAYCTAQAISRMLLWCTANCELDRVDCDFRKAWYSVLKKFYDIYVKEFNTCTTDAHEECYREQIACEKQCETSCKEPDITECTSVCNGVCTKDKCERGADCREECKYECKDCEECGNGGSGAEGTGAGSSRARSAKRAGSGSTVVEDNIRAGQKMMGPALTYNFKSYFPTYNAVFEDADSCNDGFASIWMIDRVTSSVQRWNTKSSVQNSRSGVVTGSTDNGKEASSFATNYINLANGTKVYGLAMTPQAICVKGNKAQVVAPQLVAQTGKAPGTSGTSESTSSDFSSSSDGLTNGDVTDIKVLSITEDAIKAEPNVLSWASVYE